MIGYIFLLFLTIIDDLELLFFFQMPTTTGFKCPSHVAQSYDAASEELQFRNAHRLAAVHIVLFPKETCVGEKIIIIKKHTERQQHGAL